MDSHYRRTWRRVGSTLIFTLASLAVVRAVADEPAKAPTFDEAKAAFFGHLQLERELAEIVAPLRDVDGLKKAEPKLVELEKKIQSLLADGKKLGPASPADLEKLQIEYLQYQFATTEKMLEAAVAFAESPELAAAVRERVQPIYEAFRSNPGPSPYQGEEKEAPEDLWANLKVVPVETSSGEPAKLPLVTKGHDENVTAVAFAPDGKIFATAGFRGEIHLWDAVSGQIITKLEGLPDVNRVGSIEVLQFTPDGQTLLATTGIGAILRYSLQEQKYEHLSDVEGFGNLPLDTDAAGTRLLLGGVRGLVVADTEKKSFDVIKRFFPQGAQFLHAEYSADGTHSVGVYSTDFENFTFEVFEVATKKSTLKKDLATKLDAAAVSADGKKLLTFSKQDAAIVAYDLATGEPKKTTKLEAHADRWHFSRDRSLLVAVDAHSGVKLFDPATGTRLAEFPAKSFKFFRAGDVSRAANMMVVGDSEGSVYLFPLPETLAGKAPRLVHELKGHINKVIAVSYSRDGKWIVTGGDDGAIRFWNAQTGELHKKHLLVEEEIPAKPDGIVLSRPLRDIDWLPDDATVVVVGGEGDVKFVHRDAGAKAGLSLPRLVVSNLTLLPSGKHFAAAGWFRSKNCVLVIDIKTGKALVSFAVGEDEEFKYVVLSRDGQRLAAVGDLALRVWDTKTKKTLIDNDDFGAFAHAQAVAFSPDAQQVVGADPPKFLFWNATTGESSGEVELGPYGLTSTNSVAFSPNGRLLVTGESVGKKVRIFDAQSRQQILSLDAPNSFLTTFAFSPDGKQLAWNAENDVQVWDVSAFADPVGGN